MSKASAEYEKGNQGSPDPKVRDVKVRDANSDLHRQLAKQTQCAANVSNTSEKLVLADLHTVIHKISK